MKNLKFKLALFLFLSLALARSQAFAESKKQYDEFIGEDAIIFIYVPDLANSLEALKETSIGEFFISDNMDKIANTVVKYLNLQMREKIRRSRGSSSRNSWISGVPHSRQSSPMPLRARAQRS